MAMATCPDCKGPVSTTASSCPRCGAQPPACTRCYPKGTCLSCNGNGKAFGVPCLHCGGSGKCSRCKGTGRGTFG